MKLHFQKSGLLITCFISLTLSTPALADEVANYNSSQQVIAEHVLNKAPSAKLLCTNNLNCSSRLTETFYKARQYTPLWSTGSGVLSIDAVNVLDTLRHSYTDGLNPYDYHTKELNLLLSQIEANQAAGEVPANLLAEFDLTLTDAYLLYSGDIQIGKVDPAVAYKNWPVDRRYINVLTQLQVAARDNQLVQNLHNITPQNPDYLKLRDKLVYYQQIASNGGWESIPSGSILSIGAHGERVRLVAERLAASGDYQLRENNRTYTQDLKNAIMKFQRSAGIKVTGNVDDATLHELNVPTSQRIKQIALNMDRLRWLPNQLSANYIWVNIPNYSLSVYRNGKLDLTMPVIVGGGGENKSCIVNSSVTTIETNPSWGVPRRIATKEYLSKIQADPEYLAKNSMRLYDNATGSEVDPSTVDWAQVTQKNFNYFIKQDPGRKNALGKLKFIFNNKCGIYLHDTSNPKLFAKMARSLSHGCIRVGNPLALANDLVTNNSVSWDTNKLNDAINAGTHTWIRLNNPMTIHIVYQTAWVDDSDNLIFRKDIYGIDNINFPIFIPYKKPATESNLDL